MPKFEKQYVHFMWNEELTGKFVFYAHYMDHLKDDVENNKNMQHVIGEGELRYPFIVDGSTWTFVYYDPNYETKLAYEQGKAIQFKYEGSKEWTDISVPEWSDFLEYRIKPEEKFITKRELSMWLAKGNGEWKRDSDHYIRSFTDCICNVNKDCEPIADDVVIRKWEDIEWVKPTREYMGLKYDK